MTTNEEAVETFREQVIMEVCPMCRSGQPIVEVIGNDSYHPNGQGCYANKVRKLKYQPKKEEHKTTQ